MAASKSKKPKVNLSATTTVNLVLQYSGGLQFKKAMVNGVQLVFSGGKARFSLSADGNHQLIWEVAGFIGTKWSYKLASETDGYTLDPKTLSDPGRSFTLKTAFEKPKAEDFLLVKKTEGS